MVLGYEHLACQLTFGCYEVLKISELCNLIIPTFETIRRVCKERRQCAVKERDNLVTTVILAAVVLAVFALIEWLG
jgi:hypothetical protein